MGLFSQIVDAILLQLQRAGFRAVFADGHGPSRRSWVANLANRQQRLGLRLLDVTDDVRADWRSQLDHAARNETSLVMALRPELADLDQLDADRDVSPREWAARTHAMLLPTRAVSCSRLPSPLSAACSRRPVYRQEIR